MNRRHFIAITGAALAACAYAQDLPDIRTILPDLTTPPFEQAVPAPGKRVRQSLSAYAFTAVHHGLYLPRNWSPGKKYPVLVEFPGNGPYTSPYGDVCTGDVDGCNLGYGISGGESYIVLSLPIIDATRQKNQLWWWGDVQATAGYCRAAVAQVCSSFGGDSNALILCGFSRGAIACNYIGLQDDATAALWRAFIPCSHYDGAERWDWPGSDAASAKARLQRLKGRPTFAAQEISTQNIREYIQSTGIHAPFTYQTLHFRNHSDLWFHRDIPERRALRQWLSSVLNGKGSTIT